MRWARVVWGVAGVLAFVGPLAASPVTWEFAGEITSVRDDDDLLGGAVSVGSPFSGSYTFESTTPDSDPGQPRRGLYEDAIIAVSGEVAGLPFLGPVGSTNFVETRDTSGLDQYLARTEVDFVGETLDFGVLLLDTMGTALSHDLLPVDPPDLASFNVHEFIITDTSEVIPLSLDGALTVLVPEPSMLLLLGLGALGIPKAGPLLALKDAEPVP